MVWETGLLSPGARWAWVDSRPGGTSKIHLARNTAAWHVPALPRRLFIPGALTAPGSLPGSGDRELGHKDKSRPTGTSTLMRSNCREM